MEQNNFQFLFFTGIDPLASAVQNWKRLGNFSDDDDGDEEHQEDQGHQGGQWQQGDQRVRNELPVLQVGPGPSTSSGKISRPDLAPPPIRNYGLADLSDNDDDDSAAFMSVSDLDEFQDVHQSDVYERDEHDQDDHRAQVAQVDDHAQVDQVDHHAQVDDRAQVDQLDQHKAQDDDQQAHDNAQPAHMVDQHVEGEDHQVQVDDQHLQINVQDNIIPVAPAIILPNDPNANPPPVLPNLAQIAPAHNLPLFNPNLVHVAARFDQDSPRRSPRKNKGKTPDYYGPFILY